MSQRIVDRCKPVQIDHQQSTVIICASCGCQSMSDQLIEQAAVGQAGQAVVVDQTLHAFFGSAQHADVGKNGERMGDIALIITCHANGDRLRKQIAVFAFANDFAMPRPGAVHGGANLRAKIGIVHAGSQEIGSLSDGLGGRIAGDSGEGWIDRYNPFFGVGNQDSLIAILNDAGV